MHLSFTLCLINQKKHEMVVTGATEMRKGQHVERSPTRFIWAAGWPVISARGETGEFVENPRLHMYSSMMTPLDFKCYSTATG